MGIEKVVSKVKMIIRRTIYNRPWCDHLLRRADEKIEMRHIKKHSKRVSQQLALGNFYY